MKVFHYLLPVRTQSTSIRWKNMVCQFKTLSLGVSTAHQNIYKNNKTYLIPLSKDGCNPGPIFRWCSDISRPIQAIKVQTTRVASLPTCRGIIRWLWLTIWWYGFPTGKAAVMSPAVLAQGNLQISSQSFCNSEIHTKSGRTPVLVVLICTTIESDTQSLDSGKCHSRSLDKVL